MNLLNDIVFISPANRKLGAFHRFVPRSVPLGVGILSGYMIQNGYKPAILDEEITVIDENTLAEALKGLASPKIFGISSMTTNSDRAYEMARIIKKLDPEAFILMGGIHPTVMPYEVMNKSCADAVVRGEGERPLLKIIQKLKLGDRNFSGINNMIYRKGSNIVTNEMDVTPFDVDTLEMFPYDMFDKRNYDLGFILTSRGCPFDCIFCSQRAITRRRYRSRDNNKVIEELDYIINTLGQKSIAFFDDFFTGDKKRVYKLCAMIKERGFEKKCSFAVQTRGDSVDRELLAEMKSAGFVSLMFGFETSSNHLMKVINKQETVEDNINAIKLAKELGFTVEATFIFGFPEEKYEDRMRALQIAKSLVDRARFNMATPYPGTKLYEIARAEKKLNISAGWSNFSSAGAVAASPFEKYNVPYCPAGTDPEDLVGAVFLANLLYYLNISNLKKLFNVQKKVSAKWFELPFKDLSKLDVWLDLVTLAFNVIVRAAYYISYSNECRKFIFEGVFRSGKF